ncbi:MAG: hypothetical protein AB1512_25560 [Thermodesulfobacteriota bacterium]
MRKYLILTGAVLVLVLAATTQAWAGAYVVVAPRYPAVVCTPGAYSSTVVIQEPAVVVPYYHRHYPRHYGYDPYRHPYYHRGYRKPLPPRAGAWVSSGGWGFSVGTWGWR